MATATRPLFGAGASLCPACRGFLRPIRSRKSFVKPVITTQSGPLLHTSRRQFTEAPQLRKKAKRERESGHDPSHDLTATADPFKLTELDEAFNHVFQKLKEDLSQLRPGGRFNPRVVEKLLIPSGSDPDAKKVPVEKLAQVIPKGRVLNIIADSKEQIDLVSRGIQRSDLSMTPQPDAKNPLQINVPIPPPTTEARQKVMKEADDLAQTAQNGLRSARGGHHKMLKTLQKDKSIRPDDFKKAEEKVEKKLKDAQEQVKKTLQSARKSLEAS